MRGGVFSKNIWEGASERRNENIIVLRPLKTTEMNRGNFKKHDYSLSNMPKSTRYRLKKN
jgi:hypothetical protein